MHATNFGLNHLNNRLNPNMNNVMAIDHANRDWIDDTDYLLPRIGTEFPRVANNYLNKSVKT